MKLGLNNKHIYLLCVLAGALLCAPRPCFAQRSGVKSLYKRAAGEAARAYPVETAKKATRLARQASSVKLKGPSYQTSRQAAPSLEELRRSVAELETLQKNLLEQKLFLEGQNRTRLAVFQAIPDGLAPVNTYSGTVFKTVYNGKTEIFGAIAAHTLRSMPQMPGVLEKTFRVAVVRDGQAHVMPVRVVQVSSRKLFDVALVKFRPQDEALFAPLTLAEASPAEGEVYSHGFACGLPMTVSSRSVKAVSPWVIKTTMPLEKESRAGLCGSAVLNKRHELVGIHTGSSANLQNPAKDVGYVAPASLLRGLVEAYHNGGEGAFALVLNGKEITRLNVDEFVSSVELLDKKGNILWQKKVTGKFSARQVEEQLAENRKVHVIKLVIGKTGWENTSLPQYEGILKETDNVKTVVFDWKKGRLVK